MSIRHTLKFWKKKQFFWKRKTVKAIFHEREKNESVSGSMFLLLEFESARSPWTIHIKLSINSLNSNWDANNEYWNVCSELSNSVQTLWIAQCHQSCQHWFLVFILPFRSTTTTNNWTNKKDDIEVIVLTHYELFICQWSFLFCFVQLFKCVNKTVADWYVTIEFCCKENQFVSVPCKWNVFSVFPRFQFHRCAATDQWKFYFDIHFFRVKMQTILGEFCRCASHIFLVRSLLTVIYFWMLFSMIKLWSFAVWYVTHTIRCDCVCCGRAFACAHT